MNQNIGHATLYVLRQFFVCSIEYSLTDDKGVFYFLVFCFPIFYKDIQKLFF